MKLKGLILIVLLIALNFVRSAAQDYRPMAVDNARWIVQLDEIETPWLGDVFWEYYALSDTMVNDMVYKKIYRRDLETDNHNPPYHAVSPYTLFALMRDDIEARRVYAIVYEQVLPFGYCSLGEDVLYYDFSLSTGDTANHLCISPDGCGDLIVEEVGAGEFYGINTKYLLTLSACSHGSLFEGIGSSYGLFEEMVSPFKGRYVLETSLKFYCPTADCPIVVSSNTLPVPVGISVYPNPAKNLIYVEMPENVRFDRYIIELYNTEGRLVYYTVPVSAISQIPVDYLSKGLYFLRAWDGSKWTGCKVVKE